MLSHGLMTRKPSVTGYSMGLSSLICKHVLRVQWWLCGIPFRRFSLLLTVRLRPP